MSPDGPTFARPLAALLAFLSVLWSAPVVGEIQKDDPCPPAELVARGIVELFQPSTLMLSARVTVARGRTARVVRFDLWARGGDRALLRVIEPQRDAGRGILRVGDRVYTYDPSWGRVERVGAAGERSDWNPVLFRLIDTVVGEFPLSRYRPVGVCQAETAAGEGWTAAFEAIPGTGSGCMALEIDVLEGDPTPTELRCVHASGALERWRFRRFRDVGGRRFPMEIIVDDPERRDHSATIQLLRVERGTPIDDVRFTWTALAAGE